MASAARIFVLIQPGVLDYPRLKSKLTPDNLIADAENMQLYGPIDRGDSITASQPSVLVEAQRGTPLRFTLDRGACQQLKLGSLECGAPYEAQYEASTNTWTVAGYNKNIGMDVAGSYNDAPNRPGNISVWGTLGIFDRSGQLMIGGAKVGTLAPATSLIIKSVLEEAQRGTPLRLTLAEASCQLLKLGTLECGVPYEAQYEASTNTWTVTGYDKNIGMDVAVSYNNAPNRPGNISVWGMTGIFDRAGRLMISGAKVGTLVPSTSRMTDSVLERAQRGTPLRLTLDEAACQRLKLGSLECGVPYKAQYEASTNTWTVAGYRRYYT